MEHSAILKRSLLRVIDIFIIRQARGASGLRCTHIAVICLDPLERIPPVPIITENPLRQTIESARVETAHFQILEGHKIFSLRY